MHGGMRDLMLSERGTFCVLLLVLMTSFFCAKMIDADQYLDIIKWVVTALLASKTVDIATRKPDVTPAMTPSKDGPGA